MLELRPSCECCDQDLPPSAPDAMICTFETFCRDCVDQAAFAPTVAVIYARPVRPASKLAKHPLRGAHIQSAGLRPSGSPPIRRRSKGLEVAGEARKLVSGA
jgi:hypothetical protein